VSSKSNIAIARHAAGPEDALENKRNAGDDGPSPRPQRKEYIQERGLRMVASFVSDRHHKEVAAAFASLDSSPTLRWTGGFLRTLLSERDNTIERPQLPAKGGSVSCSRVWDMASVRAAESPAENSTMRQIRVVSDALLSHDFARAGSRRRSPTTSGPPRRKLGRRREWHEFGR